MAATVLFGFAFLHLPMLGWLAVGAAPIVIHLLSRRRHRETPWAAMRYLVAALHRQSRRIRFEQWLLLLTRTAIIVLLVLAAAEPLAESVAALGSSSGAAVHRIIVLDASYSMAVRESDKSRFDMAKDVSRRIVRGSSPADVFSLILMAAPPTVVVEGPAISPDEVLRGIDRLAVQDTSVDLPATVAMLHEVIANAQREASHVRQHQVIILTDLGRVGWLPDLSGNALADFRHRSAQLAESAAISVLAIGQPTDDNRAITELRAVDWLVTAGRAANFEATVRNFSRRSCKAQPVEWWLEGRRVGQQTLDIPAEGQAVAAFSARIDEAGQHALEVRASGDALDTDNHRWLTFPVRERVKVLCINGRPSSEPFGGATDYLAYALAPQIDTADASPVRVEIATESALGERSLGPYDCVMLCDVAQFTASEATILQTYLHGGGSLIFFLGPSVRLDRYNRELRAILPAELGAVATAPQGPLRAEGFRHPIVRAFRGRGEASLVTVPVTKYVKLRVPSGSRANVVLSLSNGDPLVVEQSAAQGRVILAATSADTSWNALPLWPSFVPLVHEMLSYCLSGQQQHRNVLVGDTLNGLVPPEAGPAIQLRMPAGVTLTMQAQAHDGQAFWSFNETQESGFYAVGSSAGRPQEQFAVNVDTKESNLEQLSLERLRHEVWPGLTFEAHPAGDSRLGSLSLPGDHAGSLSVPLLYAVLGLLLAETFLAWRFGYHGS